MPGGRCQVKPTYAGADRADDELALGADVEQAGPERQRRPPRPAQISGAERTSVVPDRVQVEPDRAPVSSAQ